MVCRVLTVAVTRLAQYPFREETPADDESAGGSIRVDEHLVSIRKRAHCNDVTLTLDTSGHCENSGASQAGIAFCAVSIVADIVIGIAIPIDILHKSQLAKRVKLLAGLLLSLGSLYVF